MLRQLLTLLLVVSAAHAQAQDRLRLVNDWAESLRAGRGLDRHDDVDALLQLDDAAIVDHFLADPAFGDTALSFALHFLGRGVDRLRESAGDHLYTYTRDALALPQAVAAAVSLQRNAGDFSLFAPAPTVYLAPMQTTARAARATILARLEQRFSKVLSKLAGSGGKSAGCGLTYDFDIQLPSGIMALDDAGFDPRLQDAVARTWLPYLNAKDLETEPPGLCDRDDVDAAAVATAVKAIRAAYRRFFAAADAWQDDGARGVADLAGLHPLDVAAEGLPPLFPAFGYDGFYRYQVNAKANFSRKRAAHVLRTYFCDDLTPIDVGPPENPGHGQHGTNPACYACHYKLDPMAGLFRDRGFAGRDFSAASYLVFDDAGRFDGDERQSYLDNWRDDAGAWHVGYAIEPGVLDPAWRGDQPDDLLTFAATSPAVKACFVRKAARYFIGDRMLFDGGWLAQLSTRHLAQGYTPAGVRGLIKDLVLSRAYRAEDPEEGRCYDFPSGDAPPAGRAPCAVDHLIAASCESCHNRNFGAGGLDLTTWLTLDDDTSTFKHLKNGTQQPRTSTLQKIATRITTTELGPKMPLGRAMTPTDRQAMHRWVTSQLEATP